MKCFIKLVIMVVIVSLQTGCTWLFSSEKTDGWRSKILVDQKGEPFTFQELSGKPVVLNFAFTHCSVYCPVQTGQLNELKQQLNQDIGKDKYYMVSVSLTPDTDTPESMGAFADQFTDNNNENWFFAIAEPPVLDLMMKDTGAIRLLTNDPEQVDHTTDVYLISEEGRASQRFRGVPLDHKALYKAIRGIVKP